MTNTIQPYLNNLFQALPFRKTILNAIHFFLQAAIRAKTLVPTRVGRETITSMPRHGIKRVSRLLSNCLFTRALMQDAYCFFLKKVIPDADKITLAVDWTIIREKYCFLSISLVLNQGRSIPLFFTGYVKKQLENYESQSSIEKDALRRVLDALPRESSVTILADRGFDSPALLQFLKDRGVQFVVRIKTERYVTLKNGEEFLLHKDQFKRKVAQKHYDIQFTKKNPVRVHLYIKWESGQDEPWILVSNIQSTVSNICSRYAFRWEIEEMFKSLKNQDVGFDIKTVKLRDIDRWLRLFFLATILFQFLGQLGVQSREIPNIEKQYSLSSRPPKRQRFIFSIYSLAMLVLYDRYMKVRWEADCFWFRFPDTEWVALK